MVLGIKNAFYTLLFKRNLTVIDSGRICAFNDLAIQIALLLFGQYKISKCPTFFTCFNGGD